MDDADRLDWILWRLRVGDSYYMAYYSRTHEMPDGGWAIHEGTRALGWGAEQRDAIDDAMRKQPLPVRGSQP